MLQENRNKLMQNMIAEQVSGQLMGAIASREAARDVARSAREGQSLGSAAERESVRGLKKSALEQQRELEEKRKLLNLVAAIASGSGALGAHMATRDEKPEAGLPPAVMPEMIQAELGFAPSRDIHQEMQDRAAAEATRAEAEEATKWEDYFASINPGFETAGE